MLHTTQNEQRRNRLDRWRNTSPKTMKQMPGNDRDYIIAEVEKDAKNQLTAERIAEFNSVRDRRLPPDKEKLTTFIVVVAGALTFSIAPQLIASQAGRGPIALSAGLAGGAAASFFAHANAAKVLTGLKLKHSTQQARKAIIQKRNQERA
ncbi:MAG: hypothetical protein KME08_10905 [Aphanothece sp. CMT-3BRIN-NPC111]|jgi:hypothetical protein|nr:hypothetical protein [Aphanothece sp. CMT-3BRIN-NPC111]